MRPSTVNGSSRAVTEPVRHTSSSSRHPDVNGLSPWHAAARRSAITIAVIAWSPANSRAARYEAIHTPPFEELHGVQHRRRRPQHVRPAHRLAQQARQSPERQHRGTRRRAPVHRLVPRQGRPLCRQALRLPGKGPELRRGTRALGARRPQDHPHSAQRRRRALPPSGRGGRLLAPLAAPATYSNPAWCRRRDGVPNRTPPTRKSRPCRPPSVGSGISPNTRHGLQPPERD